MMRDILDDIFSGAPLDPVEAARAAMRPQLRRRSYKDVGVAQGEGGFALRLDGRPVRTPARRVLAAPTQALAEALAAEWRAQEEFITPAAMPLTRLANSIIDGVADKPEPVATEVAAYLATDLVLYRASTPPALAERQAAAWDPLIDWARETLGASFVLGEGLVYVAQPETALAAARAAIPRNATDTRELWRLGALHVITTLTGSALMALAMLRGRLAAEEAWAAAHADEDWNMDFWGRDERALERRAFRFAEMQAAASVLAALRD
jgi:chaperone required for assembly of F1-ATPase